MPEKQAPGVGAAGPNLTSHLTGFLATLAPVGYTEKTQHDKRRAVQHFIQWVQHAGLTITAIDESCVAAFLARRPRTRHKDHAPSALHQFLQHLRVAGVLPSRREMEPSLADLLVRRYLDHLRDHQGLCQRSLEVYAPFVRGFISAQHLPHRLGALDPLTIRRYLLDHCRDRSVTFAKLIRAALCSFLRFCFGEGMIGADLSTAVLPVRRWQQAPLPPFLTAKEIKRVITSADRSTARGQRAFAILLLLARLGLRAGEIVALELGDIRWDVGELLVRGKGRVHDRLPLPKDVGQALAVYLRKARCSSASRRVFLRRIAPHVGLSGPTAVCIVAREALRRAGLRPAGRVGAHIFRHSLATQMIRHGASLGEIAQVLRHHSIRTTQLYTRVEIEALRGVALPWPSAEAHR
ncbi:MAG TPA: tyrosine-type recombinase/integrase [Steroidobacteraceae bacterium]